MATGLPSIVLPDLSMAASSPTGLLSSIRTSLSQTGANIEAALPTGGPSLPKPSGTPAGKMTLPKLELPQIFKGPGATAETTPPKPAKAATVASTFTFK